MRQAIANFALVLSEDRRPVDAGIDAELLAYLDKVIRHPNQISDRDIDCLKAFGYTEDEIFEITISAALGAGLARLDRGMDVAAEMPLETFAPTTYEVSTANRWLQPAFA